MSDTYRIGILTRVRFGFPELITFFRAFKDLAAYSRTRVRPEIAEEKTLEHLDRHVTGHAERPNSPYRVPSHLKQKLRKYKAMKPGALQTREANYLTGLAEALETLLEAVYARLDKVRPTGDSLQESQKALKDARRNIDRRRRRGSKRTSTGNVLRSVASG